MSAYALKAARSVLKGSIKSTETFAFRRSIHTVRCVSPNDLQCIKRTAPLLHVTATSPHSVNGINTTSHSIIHQTSVRKFGRKASRMGHHLQNLDEKAHENSREEAQVRREDKKKKSKKARLNAHKEEAGSNEDENEEDIDTSLGSMEDEFGNPMLPEVSDVRTKMLMVVAGMEKQFASVRGGEATPELFDAVRVSAYGETVPLSSVGQVVIEDAQRATINCFDPAIANDVRDAVRDMPGMNLNPYVEEGGSGAVIVPIPRVSVETRKEIVKELSRKAENERQRIRRIRRDAMDVVKKGQNGKLEGISKDDAFRVGKEIEAATEEVLAAVNVAVEKKQKSVMDD